MQVADTALNRHLMKLWVHLPWKYILWAKGGWAEGSLHKEVSKHLVTLETHSVVVRIPSVAVQRAFTIYFHFKSQMAFWVTGPCKSPWMSASQPLAHSVKFEHKIKYVHFSIGDPGFCQDLILAVIRWQLRRHSQRNPIQINISWKFFTLPHPKSLINHSRSPMISVETSNSVLIVTEL